MKKIIISISAVIVFSVGTIGLVLNNYDVDEVIICSLNNESHLIPPKICELYLFKFRGTKSDIEFLKKGAGISFVFNIKDKIKREMLLDFLILNGSDINGVSHIDGLAPLHAAILLNDPDLITYLLSHNADPLVKDRDNGLTPKEFLDLLIVKDTLTNRLHLKQSIK